MSRDEEYLKDILRASWLAIRFCESPSQSELEANEREQAAILYEIGIIGEASRLLSEEFKTAHPTIPWKKIRGLRNRVIHEYKEIDISEIWLVVKRDLPDLIGKLEALIRKEPR